MSTKKLCILIGLFLSFISAGAAQERLEMWSIGQRMAKGLVLQSPKSGAPAKISRNATVSSNQSDVRIYSSGNAQSENSIAVDPANSNNLMVSTNGRFGGGNPYLYQTWFFSTDAGANWSGSEDFPSSITNCYGDPVALFGASGRAYFVTLGNPGGIYVTSTTNFGSTWSTLSNADALNSSYDDKEHASSDQSGTFPNNIYTAWTEFAPVYVNGVEVTDTFKAVIFSRSTNSGSSFGSRVTLYQGTDGGQGVNIAVGPSGEVYAAMANYSNKSLPETGMRFAKSTDGGQTFSSANVAFSITGIRYSNGSESEFNNTRVNSYPSMEVDRSNGSRRGWIYIVYADRSTGDADIYLRRSTNGGTGWSDAIRVNGETVGNGKQQWFPSCAVDQSNGALYVSYYSMDSSGANFLTNRYLARSTDGGDTFYRTVISDARFTPQVVSGSAGGYMGDYYETAAKDDRAWATWSDNRSGQFQAYVENYVVPDTINQKLSTGSSVDSIGRWETNRFERYSVPKAFQFIPGTNEVLQSAQKIISGEKYNNWNSSSDVTNRHIFSITSAPQNLTSHFQPINLGIVIRNELIDAPALNAGSIDFQDPWLIDYTDSTYGMTLRNRGMSAPFKSQTSPIYPDSSHTYGGYRYNGVMVSQNSQFDTTKPIYSARCSQNVTFGSNTGSFVGWYGNSATFSSSGSLTTAVVFPGSSDTVRARYKAHLISSQPNAASPSSQRSIVTIGATTHTVYQSGGMIWYTQNSGSGWTNETGLSLSGTAKNPSMCITYPAGNPFIHVVWEQYDAANGCDSVCYRRSTDNGSTWQGTVRLQGAAYGQEANPVVAGYPSDIVVVYKFMDQNGNGYFKMRPNPWDANTPTLELIYTGQDSKSPSLDGYSGYKLAYRGTNDSIYYNEFTVDPSTYEITYTDPATYGGPVRNLSGRANCANPTIAYMGSSVYVAWDGLNGSTRHIFARERNSGGSWLSAVEFTHGTDQETKPSIGIDYNLQKVNLLWEANSHILKASKPIAGSAWSAIYDRGAGYSPSITPINNTGYSPQALWTTGAAAPYALQLPALSAPHLQSYTSDVTGTNNQRKLARDSSGTLYLAYESEGDIWYTTSANNGATWSAERLISAGTTNNSYPCITQRNGDVYVVWQRSEGGTYWDIGYRRASDTTSSIQWYANYVNCPSPGPLPVIQAGTPAHSFEMMIVYRTASNLQSARTTTVNPGTGNWTSYTVNSTGSSSQNPCLAYRPGTSPYFGLTWDIGGGGNVYCQDFTGSGWSSTTTVSSGASAGGIYTNQYASYAIDSANNRLIAWQGYHQSLSLNVIVFSKNLNPTVYTEFGNYYYHPYYRPVITGHNSGHATLLWYDDNGGGYKAVYNGSSWGTPTSFGGKYQTVSTNNPAGGTAYSMYTSGSAAPYTLAMGSGALSKEAGDWTYSRRITLMNNNSFNSISLEMSGPSIVDENGNTASLDFAPADDNAAYTLGNIGTALTTAAAISGGTSLTLQFARTITVRNAGENAISTVVPLSFEVIDAQTGEVLARENVQVNDGDTTINGNDVMSLQFTNQTGHGIMFRLGSLPDNLADVYSASFGHIYMSPNPDAPKKSLKHDRFAQQKPATFNLSNNYPNPFNPATTLNYQLASAGYVNMEVYNSLGQEVKQLVDDMKEAGYYTIRWDAGNLSSGVYFIRLRISDQLGKPLYQDVKKLMLVK
jgi:hypothetical protein